MLKLTAETPDCPTCENVGWIRHAGYCSCAYGDARKAVDEAGDLKRAIGASQRCAQKEAMPGRIAHIEAMLERLVGTQGDGR